MYYLTLYLIGAVITYGVTFAKLRLGYSMPCNMIPNENDLWLELDRIMATFSAALWPIMFFGYLIDRDEKHCIRAGFQHGFLFRDRQDLVELAWADFVHQMEKKRKERNT